MPLSSTIATILSRSKSLEICDTLHDVQNVTTEEDLIDAGLPLAIYAYQQGIVDDALLASDFTEATLNSKGVYTTGTFTLTNPDEIFIFRNANVTVNMTGGNKCKVNVLGGATLTIVAGDTSYAFIKGYGTAAIGVTANDNAIVNIDIRESVVANITTNANSILQMVQSGNTNGNLYANNNSNGIARTYSQAVLNIYLADSALVDALAFNSSQINYPALP